VAQGADDHEGYFNLPDETSKALTADGYFKTGDLGKIDEEGFLHITGRKKELIIVAGEKAVPREIEELIMKHPAVREAAVVGKKDPGRGKSSSRLSLPKRADCDGGRCAGVRAIAGTDAVEGAAGGVCGGGSATVADGKVLKRVLSEQVNSG
jgi:acyl-CoA synthetase (AMP-forming)/AMP-acid ligase II